MKAMARRDAIRARRAPTPALDTHLARTGQRTFVGHARDPHHPEWIFTVELLIDGRTRAVAIADRPEAAGGESNRSFRFVLDAPPTAGAVIEARIANIGTPVGAPLLSDAAPKPDTTPGAVRWQGGLRFGGWIGMDNADGRFGVHVDGQLITETRVSGWTMIGEGDDARPARSFDIHLPARFADGRVHRLTMTMPDGATLLGGSIVFTATGGGFADTLEPNAGAPQRLRAELLDRLVPMSFPMARYGEWRDLLPSVTPSVSDMEIGVIAVGPGNVTETVETLEEQSHADWVAAALPDQGSPCGFDGKDASAFVAEGGAGASAFVLTLAGSRIAPNALATIAGAFVAFPDAQIVYPDVEILDADGQPWPVCFPAFDAERMLEQGYAAHVFAVRRGALEAALAAGASDIYAVFNTVVAAENERGDAVVHVPRALATLPSFDLTAASAVLASASQAFAGSDVTVKIADDPGMVFPAVRVQRSRKPGSVAVVVMARNRPESLRRCIASLEPAIEMAGARLIVVDNDSADPAAVTYLADLRALGATVIHAEGTWNTSHLANIGVAAANTDYVCLINDHVTALSDEWLDELLGRIADPAVAAAGPLMLYPGGVVAHMGMVAGPAFAAAPALVDRTLGDPGYADLLKVAHQQSALGPGCILVRRYDYQSVGGMDGIRFPDHLGIVDLCLKLGAAGGRIVVTPHARMQTTKRWGLAAAREVDQLRAIWADTLAADPLYSPHLSLDGVPFSVLAWPPREQMPRTNTPPRPHEVPPGF